MHINDGMIWLDDLVVPSVILCKFYIYSNQDMCMRFAIYV